MRIAIREMGIQAVLVDVDDTLMRTRAVFRNFMDEVYRGWESLGVFNKRGEWFEEMCARQPDVQTIFREVFVQAIVGLRGELVVNPVIMEAAIMAIAPVFGLTKWGEEVGVARATIRQIYTTCPEVIPGAREVLGRIRALGLWCLAATHAERGWTGVKNQQGELGFLPSDMWCFDVTREKGDQWQELFAHLSAHGLSPEVVLAIGDGLVADIIPVLQLGGRAVWIRDGNQFGASTARLAQAQEEYVGFRQRGLVWEVDTIGDLQVS